MKINLKRYSKIITDVSYSIIAYALPTFALYFIIQPVVARQISSEENGLFLTILSIVRYSTNILITPLATLRLLEKNSCASDNRLELKFNYIFFIVSIIGVIVTGVVVFLYSNHFDPINVILSLVFLVILFFHDYYSIIFRIIIDFKKITIDNAFIVIGFIVGLGLFYFIRFWQLIFIAGYLLGSIYVFVQSRRALQIGKKRRLSTPEINKKYVELSATNTLSHSVIYCDKLLIYPVLGGTNVSIYNAAGVVSKVISIVSIPLRNVLLSYLVDKKELSIKRTTYRNILLIIPFLMILLTVVFSFLGIVLCKFLYPMFYEDAVKFIPMIVGAIVINTTAGISNLVLLQFAKTYLQTLISAIRLFLYLLFVFILTIVLHKALWGFCWSTFLTACIYFVIVIILTRRNVNIK